MAGNSIDVERRKDLPPAASDAPCPVCGNTRFAPLIRVRDNRTGAFETPFHMVRCTQCRLVALRPLPAERELMAVYEAGYHARTTVDAAPPTVSDPSACDVAASPMGQLEDRLRRYWHILDGNATIDRVHVRGRVLDIGAGTGANVEYLLRHGYDVIGVDPNRDAVAACAAKGLPVVQGTLETAQFEPGSFDTVILSQVLEHLLGPAESLRIIWRMLRPGGRVCLFTPNIEAFSVGLFGEDWAHWHPPYHVYLYGPDQLRQLLATAGFGVARLSTVTPAYWVNMSLQLRRHRSGRTGWTLPPDAWRPGFALRLALMPLFRVVDLLGRGDCMIGVGIKP